jgi:hypothetical protein
MVVLEEIRVTLVLLLLAVQQTVLAAVLYLTKVEMDIIRTELMVAVAAEAQQMEYKQV